MRVALVIEAAGAPHSLAMTAFAGALAEGVAEAGHEVKVFGVATTPTVWLPETLGQCAAVAPWLSPRPARSRDRFEAARRGVLDEQACCGGGALWCGPSDWYRELLFERELRAFARGGSPGVVMFYPRSYPVLKTVARVARRLGWKVLAFSTEALSDNQIDPATRDGYIRCVACCADAVWAFSTYLRDFWDDHGVSRDRVIVLPPVVRPTTLLRPSVAPMRGTAVYTGSLAHREADYLIEVAGIVGAQIPEFTLDIYGDGSDARRTELERKIVDCGLEKTVSLRPPVAPVDVPPVLARADVLLLPRAHGQFSTAGFPNKLGEYLASGRPAIVTSVGDIPTHLRHGLEAMLIRPDDNSAFAEAVVSLLREPEMGDLIGAAGRAYAENNLRADVVVARVLEFISARPSRASRSFVSVTVHARIRARRSTCSRLTNSSARLFAC